MFAFISVRTGGSIFLCLFSVWTGGSIFLCLLSVRTGGSIFFVCVFSTDWRECIFSAKLSADRGLAHGKQ